VVIVAANIVVDRRGISIAVAGPGVAACAGKNQDEYDANRSDYQHNYHDDSSPRIISAAGRLIGSSGRRRCGSGRIANGNLGVSGNGVCHSTGDGSERMSVAKLLEVGNHFPSVACCLACRYHRFQSCADFNAIFMVLYRQQDEDAAIIGLGSYAPLAKKSRSETFNAGTVKAMNSYNGDLGLGAAINLLAKIAYLAGGFRIKNIGKIVDEPRRLELLDLLGASKPTAGYNTQGNYGVYASEGAKHGR
jgi:hypothetical protein